MWCRGGNVLPELWEWAHGRAYSSPGPSSWRDAPTTCTAQHAAGTAGTSTLSRQKMKKVRKKSRTFSKKAPVAVLTLTFGPSYGLKAPVRIQILIQLFKVHEFLSKFRSLLPNRFPEFGSVSKMLKVRYCTVPVLNKHRDLRGWCPHIGLDL